MKNVTILTLVLSLFTGVPVFANVDCKALTYQWSQNEGPGSTSSAREPIELEKLAYPDYDFYRGSLGLWVFNIKVEGKEVSITAYDSKSDIAVFSKGVQDENGFGPKLNLQIKNTKKTDKFYDTVVEVSCSKKK